MWMNLDTLPADTHQYVAFVGDRDQNWSNLDEVVYDEIDFQAGAHASSLALINAAMLHEDAASYDLTGTQEILGIADQSSGEWVFVSEHGRLLRKS